VEQHERRIGLDALGQGLSSLVGQLADVHDLLTTAHASAADRVRPGDIGAHARERRIEVTDVEGRIASADQVRGRCLRSGAGRRP
jgi:hypothetical protein